MKIKTTGILLIFTGILLCIIAAPVTATPDPAYTITYTISLQDDGSASWQVDYRTLLVTDEDITTFNEYTRQIDTVYLPQLQEIMEHSASQAAAATTRYMAINNFSGTGNIQTAPTGRYGIIRYTFTWMGFARPGSDILVGDAFAGGMYLPKEATLIIHAPEGYMVKTVQPEPDQTYNGLTWYGLRSFSAGEPGIVFERTSIPVSWIFAVILVIAAGAVSAGIMYRIRKNHIPEIAPAPDAPSLSEAEILSINEKILQIVRSHGGEMYQSGIVKDLGLPKSSISAALNNLHARGLIQKIKKGRENLIRLL
ncbi:MAG: transcriptional regulator [Methanoregula sp.]|jgi:uncharacterized membrane protein